MAMDPTFFWQELIVNSQAVYDVLVANGEFSFHWATPAYTRRRRHMKKRFEAAVWTLWYGMMRRRIGVQHMRIR